MVMVAEQRISRDPNGSAEYPGQKPGPDTSPYPFTIEPFVQLNRDQLGPAGLIRGSFGFINRIVMLIDATAAFVTLLLIQKLSILSATTLNWPQSLIVGMAASAATIGLLRAARAYRVERYADLGASIYDVARGALAAAGVTLALLWTYAPGADARPVHLFGAGSAVFASLMSGRLLARIVHHHLLKRGFLRRRVAIIGSGMLGREIAAHIRREQERGNYTLVGLFGDEVGDVSAQPREIAGTVRDLRHIAQHRQIDMIVLALPWSRAEQIFELAAQVQWISADVVVPIETSGFVPQSLTRLGGRDMLLLASHPFRGTQGLVKVIEDYVVAAFGLLLALPIMLFAAIAVRLEGEGPILFRQPRLGFNGRLFHIYKFRTMTVDPADDGSVAVERGSPRITRIGALLRRSSIDELPQLFNVLRGEMSIVGPRPHVPGMLIEGDVYSEMVRSYAARHRMKPGITGWAQINGMRGGIDTAEKARRNVDLDLHYARNWSLRLDLWIMRRTLTRNLIGRDIF
ncbi:hypothetical protein CLG96_15520 [Sphingomonas oleivorans]|uniref:Bacterial sugar transferase domain-containing protein n=1 Tax=Sphingomonas oleivorans TaxID=1735121 RepID=A0A2T5FV50_9SPHN|nr:exopolysaccharide biosynthesis polyprenyl glycosylphosphotransferase [Sphingomonas oleivorans]PTQ08597.1 hypothetical protein CLG96_15520 [Sphingomonas oleivorans]